MRWQVTAGVLGVVVIGVLVTLAGRDGEPRATVKEPTPPPAPAPAPPRAERPPVVDAPPPAPPRQPPAIPSGATPAELSAMLPGLPEAADALHVVEALEQHPDGAALAELARLAAEGSSLDVRRLAVQSLGRKKAARELETLARRDTDPSLRGDAALALAEAGADARTLRALYEAEPEALTRRMEARALAREGSAEASRFLVQQLRVGKAGEVLDPLRTVENPASFDVFRDLLATGTDPAHRAAAAEALGKMKDPRAVALLLAALDRANPTPLREAAALGLGMLGATEALPALDAIAADESDPVRQAARQAVARIRFVATK